MRYNPIRKSKLFHPSKPFSVSRSKIAYFKECPRCFYLDRVRGLVRPPGYAFSLNNAVDILLKKEFDHYRRLQRPHPLMVKNGVSAIPYQHADLEKWRHNFTGVRYFHEKTNLTIYGAVDDIWQNSNGELIVVDYKATSKQGHIVSLTEAWQDHYKRQLEVYQWLLKMNGFHVSPTGYFVYCNGSKTEKNFHVQSVKNSDGDSILQGSLLFEITLVPHNGNTDWIDETIFQLKQCLLQKTLPTPAPTCEYCQYVKARKSLL